MLEKLAAAVCQQGGALLCFDFPAHGESPVGEEMLSVANCKEDLCAVAAYASVQYPDARKSVFATSFGGYITLLCAQRLGNIPLILRAPAVTMPKVLLENVLQITAEEFKNSGAVTCGFERPIQLPYAFYEDLLSQPKLLEERVLSPMLLIHGDQDDVVPLADVQAFGALQNNLDFQIIPGADHRFKNPGELEKIVSLTQRFLGI